MRKSDVVEIIEPGLESYYCEPDWREWAAPVVPPRSIVEKLMKGGRAFVDWENEWHPWYTMYYRTEFYRNAIVTRLRPGSIIPVEGWLYHTILPG